MPQVLYDYSLCLVYYIEHFTFTDDEGLHMKSKSIRVKKAYVKNDVIEKFKVSRVGFVPSFIFIKRPELDHEVFLRFESDKNLKHRVLWGDNELYYNKYDVVDILKL